MQKKLMYVKIYFKLNTCILIILILYASIVIYEFDLVKKKRMNQTT